MNSTPLLRKLDIFLIFLTTLAMHIAFSRQANACPPDRRDDGKLSFSGLMMNFNRYVKTADFLALTPGEKWSTAQSEISLAIADLAVAIDCAQVGASDQSLLPSGALSFDADKKASYILAYVKWMNEYSLILTSYRDELKRLLDLVSRTDVSEIDLSEYYSLKNQANEIVDQSHQKLRTSGWCEDQLK